MLRCKKCGTPVEEGDKFCTVCGSLQDRETKHETKEEIFNTKEYISDIVDETDNVINQQAAEDSKHRRKRVVGILGVVSVVIFIMSYTVYVIASPKSTDAKKSNMPKNIASNKEKSNTNTNSITSANPQQDQSINDNKSDASITNSTNDLNTNNSTSSPDDTNINGGSTDGITWERNAPTDNANDYNNDGSMDTKDSSYIFPDSSKRQFTKQELNGYNQETLQLGIAEIFARHGYVFTGSYKSYFENKSWYNPNPNFKGYTNELSSVEKNNIKVMVEAGGKNLIEKGKQDLNNIKNKVKEKKAEQQKAQDNDSGVY